MKNKALYIILGLTVVGVGGYFIYRQFKFKSGDPIKDNRKIVFNKA
jgi:hypothetical protein